MKKILILASHRNENKEKFITYLKKYFESKAEIFLETLSEVSIELREDSLEVFVGDYDIRDFDLVYFRSTGGYMARAKTLALALNFLKIKYIDTVWGKASVMGDKLTSLANLASKGFPIIPSLFTNLENKKKIDDFTLRMGFPIIAKELTSQRLEGVYVISNLNDFKKLPELKHTGKQASYLFQKFVDIENEYRLVVFGNRVSVTHTKVRRNYAKRKVQDLNKEDNIKFIDSTLMPGLNKIAIDSARALDLEIAGVDICVEKGSRKVWIVEVNRGPGVDYDTDFSPELYAFADFLEKNIS